VLHGKNKLNHITLPLDDDLICFDIIAFHQCPGQYNGIDCGLFCIAVVLHLLDFKPVTEDTFNFNHCILLRSKLAAHFNRKNDYANDKQVKLYEIAFQNLRVGLSSAAMVLRSLSRFLLLPRQMMMTTMMM
jgi:hypothetical protein